MIFGGHHGVGLPHGDRDLDGASAFRILPSTRRYGIHKAKCARRWNEIREGEDDASRGNTKEKAGEADETMTGYELMNVMGAFRGDTTIIVMSIHTPAERKEVSWLQTRSYFELSLIRVLYRKSSTAKMKRYEMSRLKYYIYN